MIFSVLTLLLLSSLAEALHIGSCLGLVCGRNGQCLVGPSSNSHPTYWCRCDDGFGGDFCEQRCDLKCGNDKKCVFDVDSKPSCVCKECDKNGIRLTTETICPSGYGGDKCVIPGWCYPHSCENGGLCVGSGAGAQCVCAQGFAGERCEMDVDECSDAKVCGSSGSCVNTHGSYVCVCPKGLLPPDCSRSGNQTETDGNKTACFLKSSLERLNGQSMYCQNGGVCDTTFKQPKCHCPPGFEGSSCEIRSRAEGPCANSPCQHGTCVSFPGGFQCVCDDGYGGSYCDEGQDNCADNKCDSGSVCINGINSYYCDCPLGRTGQYCDKVDCNAIPGMCNHGTCLHSPLSDKSFECQCEPGYEGELCDMDKNECLSANMCLNNGTCVNLPGSFRCDCPRGFGGKWCDELVDMCENIRCEHGGQCMHTLERSPICQCKNGFIGKRCEKECPSGIGGVRCDIRLDTEICSRQGGKCFNGGKCISGFCACPPDFTGNQCEISRKEAAKMASDNTCQSEPCMNNATCINVDAHIGYACICQQGFEGDICERHKDLCVENPCANGGRCQQKQESFACHCPSGFHGERCEMEKKLICHNSTCKNGGMCHSDGNTTKCECSYGFTGPRCEEKLNLGEFYDKESLFRSICEKRKCQERANDGNCDADCNYAACKFDGGDCSGKREPFARCNYGNMCADLFANGVCNQACNNENCLYDGMDCMSAVVRCPAKIREYCAARFANGVCDLECNADGCGFDGGDCANKTEATILTDIRIKIQMNPAEFQTIGGPAMMEISSALRAAVRIQRDEEGPLVFEWDGEKEGKRVEMDVKKLAEQRVLSTSVIRKIRSALSIGGESKGVAVYLEVQEDCVRGKCLYRDAQSIVDIISARLAKKGTDSFGVPISEAMIATPSKSGEFKGSSWNNIIYMAGAFCIMGVAVAGVLSVKDNRNRKRRMVNAPVWMPPMGNDDKNRRQQSINSSQHSLLEANGYYDPKRQRSEYEVDQNGQYSQFYPQSYRNGYMEPYGTATHVNNKHPEQQRHQESVVHHIPLLQQAAGVDAIIGPITKESVRLKDPVNNRTVLHYLAANINGKPEDLIGMEVSKCIQAGADVNAMDQDENTPLMLAVRSRRVRLAVIFMKAGADPTIYNKSERSALHEAAVNRDLIMMQRLLTDKRIVRDIEELDRNGMTVLMTIALKEGEFQIEMAQLLLAKGAKIDSDGKSRVDTEKYSGRTALHYAALFDNLPMVEFLVSQNANKDKQDEAGQTPIMLAAKCGHENTVMMLIRSGASVEAVDSMDFSARQLAMVSNHRHIVEILDQYRPNLEYQGEMRHLQQGPQQAAPPTNRKTARATYKSVKKQTNRKKEQPSSRDSTHLTPPPSDGSTSSPSPQHFLATSHTTPTGLNYMSPDYQPEVAGAEAFQPQCNAHPSGDMWFTASPTYAPMSQNEPMMHRPEAAYQYY
ncbi:unnamed protein product [Caenorhabditis sp. 36 PRJEB53466]|nr:unnamed protein product [Caenorhabditis sp. 36 PRJEB53466]